jgi:tRNA(Arg) A34 adenosine deaminase TadA
MGLVMNNRNKLNRRDFIVKTAGVAGSASASGSVLTPAYAQTGPAAGLDAQEPLAKYWRRQLREIVNVDLGAAAPELANEAVKERHRIYCFLLMALISRFWNGNKRGPLGYYPQREKQKEPGQNPQGPLFRYRGDVAVTNDPLRVNWDRYLGHNTACLAVDGNGEVINFDFDHSELFRSSADHAEARLVKRLFSVTDVSGKWKTGEPITTNSRPFSLSDVTIYTSLESCAQCSGMMSLAGVKQVVYLQADFTAYMIGNIMFNLANPVSGLPGAPIPIPAAATGLQQFHELNNASLTFIRDQRDAMRKKDKARAFFVSPDGDSIFSPSITSFLCTDTAYGIFQRAADQFISMQLSFPAAKFPNASDVLDNQKCLDEAKQFLHYADVEGFRGSPHKS